MRDELIGRALGQYHIKRRLGQGGMADVFVATQSSMNRDVAIKVISSELAEDEEFVARFRREADVIAQLQHPHIVPVIDFGQDGDLLYIVMRLVTAGSLDQRLHEKPLTLEETVEMLRQIGGALDYAHLQGIVHRDLKPSNVLLDENNNAYLTDFGLAKLAESDSGLTGSQSILGTPFYMSPEQWRGQEIDGRSDIYSLGIMVYEMLTGNHPFVSTTPYELMYKHINEAPPSLCDLTGLPRAIEEVVLKAIAKDPDDRFQRAQDMARTMTNAFHSSGISERPTETSLDDLDETVYGPPSTEDLAVPTRREPVTVTFGASGEGVSTQPKAAPPATELQAAVAPATVALPARGAWYLRPWALVSGTTLILAAVVLMAMLTGIGRSGGAEDVGNGTSLVVQAAMIGVRAGPGESFPIIGQAMRDSQYDVIAVDPSGEWYQIVFVDKFGWVPAADVRVQGSTGITVVQVPTYTAEAPPATATQPPATATNAPAPTQTPLVAATPVAMVVPVIETFDTIGELNWDRNEANRYLLDGQYHTLVLPGEGGSGLALAQSMAPVSDLRLEIEVEDLSTVSSQVVYGVLFRVQDTSNFYRFTVTSDGQAGVIKRVDSQDEALPFTTIYNWDDAEKAHVLKLEMVGPEMVLYVDGRVVLRYVDTDIRSRGGIGLAAFREGAHIAWDNLRVEPITHLSDPLGLATTAYEDDFQDNRCQWTNYANLETAYLKDGQYHLEVPPGDSGIQVRCANLALYQNAYVEVLAHDQGQDRGSGYGLVFRQNRLGDDYYRLVVTSVGQVALQKQAATDPDCQPCNLAMAPLPGYDRSVPHLLAVEVFEDVLRGYIDGELVIEAEDDAILEPGVIRLAAYGDGTHVTFDDLSIRPITELSAVEKTTPLPEAAAAIVGQDTAPLVLARDVLTVSIEQNAGSPAMVGELPVAEPGQDFVFAARASFETASENDQCGLLFRATLPDVYRWINLTGSGLLAYGDADRSPARPVLLGQWTDGAEPVESAEMLVVARGETVRVFLDGTPVEELNAAGEVIETADSLLDENPVIGQWYLWVFLSGNHAATCRFEDVHLWTLD